MVTIVSAAERHKDAVATDRGRFAAYSEAVTAGVGYDQDERIERRAEIEGHLEDMYGRALRAGRDPHRAADDVIAGFGNAAQLRRRLWQTRLLADVRAAWRLSGVVCALMLVDLVASTIWIGIDLDSGATSATRYASLLVVFTFATTVLYWVAMTLGYGGLLVARRTLRYRAPAIELVLACGLLGSAATVFFSLRPGAVANAIGSLMETHVLWRSVWEWAGAVFPVLTFIGVGLIAWRARRAS